MFWCVLCCKDVLAGDLLRLGCICIVCCGALFDLQCVSVVVGCWWFCWLCFRVLDMYCRMCAGGFIGCVFGCGVGLVGWWLLYGMCCLLSWCCLGVVGMCLLCIVSFSLLGVCCMCLLLCVWVVIDFICSLVRWWVCCCLG